jgi:propanol-preferring alcohol dehydrogenase
VIVSEINPDLVKAAVELGIPESDIVPVGKSLVDFIQESGLYGKVDTVLDFVGKHQTFEDAQHIGESPLYLLGSLLC